MSNNDPIDDLILMAKRWYKIFSPLWVLTLGYGNFLIGRDKKLRHFLDILPYQRSKTPGYDFFPKGPSYWTHGNRIISLPGFKDP
jgi:hypothetical protein